MVIKVIIATIVLIAIRIIMTRITLAATIVIEAIRGFD